MVGKFITFEGGEGAGKSTQIRRLAARLEEAGLRVVTTREPGGTPAAEAIRQFILTGRAEAMGAEGEALLFAAARVDHVMSIIRPALAAGDWVLSDRFTDSTRVYQGAEGGVAPATLDALERVAVGQNRPDLTVILDIPAETGLRRVRARQTETGIGPDRFDSDELGLHERRRQAYLALAARDPGRYLVVDAIRRRGRSRRRRVARCLGPPPPRGGVMADEIPRLDALDGWPPPEAQPRWYAGPAAETTLLDAYRGGRMHHAWLLGGPKGIGKATLAYRFARFAFAHPDPASAAVAAATDLSVSEDSPAFRRVVGRAHPNLLAMERPWDDKNKRYKTELAVDEIRRTRRLLRLDQRGGGVAYRHRRPRRRDEPERGQRPPQSTGGAADALPLLRHQPYPRAGSSPPSARAAAGSISRRSRRRPSPARSATMAASTRTMPTSSSLRRLAARQPSPRHPAPRGRRHRHLPRLRPLRRHGRRSRRHRHACARRPRLGTDRRRCLLWLPRHGPRLARPAGPGRARAGVRGHARTGASGPFRLPDGRRYGRRSRSRRSKPMTLTLTASRSCSRSSCRSPAPHECDHASRPRPAAMLHAGF